MTDIELLPLPDEVMDEMDGFRRAARVSVSDALSLHNAIRDYARAVAEHNVSRALAPVGGLGLRDALLRARAKLSDGEWEDLCRVFREQDSIIRRALAGHNVAMRDAEVEAERADRLAEALAADREMWEAQKAGAIRDQAGGMARGDTAAVSRCDAAIQRINDALRDYNREKMDG